MAKNVVILIVLKRLSNTFAFERLFADFIYYQMSEWKIFATKTKHRENSGNG